MYIFTRTITVNRHKMFEGIAASIEIAALASEIAGLPIAVYGSRFGAPLNTIMWSARYESQAQVEEVSNKLGANAEYMAWIMSHADSFDSAPVDQLTNVVSATLAAKPKKFYTSLTAVATSGRLGDAVAFGVKAQEFVANASGLTTMFGTAIYGAFGTVGWLTGADTLAELDALVQMQMTNAEYHTLLAEAAPLFIAGSGINTLIEKLN